VIAEVDVGQAERRGTVEQAQHDPWRLDLNPRPWF
jgi:hypothetical protein